MGGRCSRVALLALDKPCCEEKWPDNQTPHWCSSMSSGPGCHPYFWCVFWQHYKWKKNSAAFIPVKYSLHVIPKWRACGWLIQFCLLSWQQTMNDAILTNNCLPSASNRLLYKCTHTSHTSCSNNAYLGVFAFYPCKNWVKQEGYLFEGDSECLVLIA